MAIKSSIQWTDATWNIARGCTKVDEDCKFCYMYRESLDSTRYNPLNVVKTKTVFNLPLKLKEPSKIFTSSLTDFFHEDCDAFRDEAWEIIRKCPQHTFQILTKRPERIIEHLPKDWGSGWSNVWLGTSVGHQDGIHRLDSLLEVPTKIRFLSAEPLHGQLILTGHQLVNLNWIIIGGESGNETGKYRYRECSQYWIYGLLNQCVMWSVPVFVKQMGTDLSKTMGLKDRHGGDINEWPEIFRVRQFPN